MERSVSRSTYVTRKYSQIFLFFSLCFDEEKSEATVQRENVTDNPREMVLTEIETVTKNVTKTALTEEVESVSKNVMQSEEVETVTKTVMEPVDTVQSEDPVTMSDARKRVSSYVLISIMASYCNSYLGHTISHLVNVLR